MSQWGHRTAVVVCLLLVGTGSVATMMTQPATASPASASNEPPIVAQVDSASATNNTTTRHEDPSQTDENGDLNAVERHLAGVLAGRLSESAVQLDQGQYEQARELLGDEYSQKWGQYVDVAGEVDAEQTAERFEETQSTQREYTSTVSEFQSTYDEYREAKQNGNDTRARQLARQLVQLSNQANETAAQLTGSYDNLGNQTGANLTTATESVVETQTNITAVESNVTSEELVRTQLSVSTSADSASFTSPVQLSGQLTTQTGEAVGDAQIVVPVPGRNVTTTTADDGSFTLQYRPIRLEQTETALTVQYVPAETSVFLGTNATQSLRVEPVNGTLSVTTAPTQSVFGEQVTVRGELRVNTTPVPSVPLTIQLGGTDLGTVQTAQQGNFSFTTTLPASVPAGSQPLRVAFAEPDRAVTASPVTRQVSVEETPTTLTATGELVNASTGQVRLSGSLSLENGSAVSEQPVVFRINETTIGSTQTGPNGTYSQTVSIPESALEDSENVTIAAVFTGQGANLAGSQSQTRISVTSGLSQATSASELLDWLFGWVNTSQGGGLLGSLTGVSRLLALPGWMQATGLLLVVLFGGLGFSIYRRQQQPIATSSTATAEQTQAETQSSDTPLESPLAAARVALREGETDKAIELIYSQIRQELTPELGLSTEVTHWEFFTACQAAFSDSRRETVQRLTEWYEQAAYGPEDMSRATAQEALLLAASLFETESDPTDASVDQPVADGSGGQSDMRER